MLIVVVLAVLGLAVLAAAILTGNTILALVVIALALVGLLLLARDWFRDRRRAEPESAGNPEIQPEEQHESVEPGVERVPEVNREKRALEPDQFEPDVSYEDAEEADEETQHHPAGRERPAD
jgi:hypothetical protein